MYSLVCLFTCQCSLFLNNVLNRLFWRLIVWPKITFFLFLNLMKGSLTFNSTTLVLMLTNTNSRLQRQSNAYQDYYWQLSYSYSKEEHTCIIRNTCEAIYPKYNGVMKRRGLYVKSAVCKSVKVCKSAVLHDDTKKNTIFIFAQSAL